MNNVEINITEADIIRSIKNLQYSPIEYAAARTLKENVDNVEVKTDCIIIWNEDDSDYESYIYSDEYLDKVRLFIEEWWDFKDNIIDEFCGEPFDFKANLQK
jgi:hypothetical protein